MDGPPGQQEGRDPCRGNSESAADLTIDPGSRTLVGPNQQKLFDTGQIKFSEASAIVPLGEVRTDPQAHLLVLGGSGTSASPPGTLLTGDFWANDDWYDDVSDGPITATIKLHADGTTPAVTGAWVLVAPPNFAPHQKAVITLYDRILEAMIEGGLVAKPTTTSYTNDVYPILQRARDTRWVDLTMGAHTWADPVVAVGVRNAIFNKLKKPGGGGGTMPMINDSGTGDDRLTQAQYDHMQRWNTGGASFVNDWTGVPAPEAGISPAGLDRAALEACVGGAFFPGIETGGLPGSRPILDATKYLEPFRIDHAKLAPGDLTAVMALPWQADFYQCKDSWWPVPRPNYVTRGGVAEQLWVGDAVGSGDEMVARWHTLGFVVRQGAQHVEVDRCDLVSIQLLTPLLDFQDVPQGPMGMVRESALAITFEVTSPGAAVTLQYAPGGAPNHPQLVAFNSSVTVGPTAANAVATARLWVIYRTSSPGDVLPPQTVTVQDAGATQSWNITILGNTVARKTAAAALVMDRSGSMADDRGDGLSKHVSLQQAAAIFVDVMLEGDGVALVRFNQDAQVLEPVVTLGDGGLSDINRQTTKDIINGNGLDPGGETSIGDGIFEGRGALNSTPTPFDVKALVVLTDGIENQPRSIADVAGDLNEFTYAVGLGQPQNISVPALQTISGNTGGYLLVTGAIGTDNRFLLQKYFLQILAGISNAEIVLDPAGQLVPGRVERVPFQLTSGDAGVDVILLTPSPQIVDFRIQTPSGQIIDPARAAAEPGMRFVLSSGVSYYRMALPFEFMPGRFDAGGTWHALLTIGRPRIGRQIQGNDQVFRRQVLARPAAERSGSVRGFAAQREAVLAAEAGFARLDPRAAVGTLPYSLVVHSYSNLSLRAHVEQASFEPGAQIALHAALAQSGIPLVHRAKVWAEVRRPDGTSLAIDLVEQAEGRFVGQLATTAPGAYAIRIRARGTTYRSEPFMREQTLTAAVWRGGDRPPAGGGPGCGPGDVIDCLRDRDARLCELLRCLVARDGVVSAELEKRLAALGFSLTDARACLERFCRGNAGGC